MTESMSIHDDAEVSTVDFCLPIKLVRRKSERDGLREIVRGRTMGYETLRHVIASMILSDVNAYNLR